jgi:oxaloacetate decarboxylase gamma subunit
MFGAIHDQRFSKSQCRVSSQVLSIQGERGMDTNLLLQGVELLLLGMGIVFGFLTLLVFMLRGMSGLAARIAPPDEPLPTLTPATAVSDDRRVIAAISAAVARYRASR